MTTQPVTVSTYGAVHTFPAIDRQLCADYNAIARIEIARRQARGNR